jgi:hypothetical protein
MIDFMFQQEETHRAANGFISQFELRSMYRLLARVGYKGFGRTASIERGFDKCYRVDEKRIVAYGHRLWLNRYTGKFQGSVMEYDPQSPLTEEQRNSAQQSGAGLKELQSYLKTLWGEGLA